MGCCYPCMGPAWPALLSSIRLRKGPPSRGSWALASAVLKWYSVTLSRRSWGIPPPRSEMLWGREVWGGGSLRGWGRDGGLGAV